MFINFVPVLGYSHQAYIILDLNQVNGIRFNVQTRGDVFAISIVITIVETKKIKNKTIKRFVIHRHIKPQSIIIVALKVKL